MMSLTIGLFTQVSGSGPLGPRVFSLCRIVFTKPEDLEVLPNYSSFHLFTVVRSPSCSHMPAIYPYPYKFVQ